VNERSKQVTYVQKIFQNILFILYFICEQLCRYMSGYNNVCETDSHDLLISDKNNFNLSGWKEDAP
jgi:hypothetical protein